MREMISFHTKWAFSKEAAGVPQQMPKKLVLGESAAYME